MSGRHPGNTETPPGSTGSFFNSQGKRFLLSSLVFAEMVYGAYQLDDAREDRKKHIAFIENLNDHYRELVVSVSLEIAPELPPELHARRCCQVPGWSINGGKS